PPVALSCLSRPAPGGLEDPEVAPGVGVGRVECEGLQVVPLGPDQVPGLVLADGLFERRLWPHVSPRTGCGNDTGQARCNPGAGQRRALRRLAPTAYGTGGASV